MESASAESVLVCFDLGRVLVRICDTWGDAFRRADRDELGRRVEAQLRSGAEGATLRTRVSELVHALERGDTTPAAFSDASAVLLGCSAEDIAKSLEVFIHGAYPGAVQLLQDLTAARVAVACLSNTNALHWQIMSAWSQPEDRIWPHLPLRLGSHEVRARKPDDAIYAALELKSGRRGSQVVFFDDLDDNIAAASARGWRAFAVRSRQDPVSEMRAQLVALGMLAR
jgi:putative hydrolase of the HAD superfamily